MRRGLLCLCAVLVVLASAPAASARRPVREVVPSPDDVVITGQCAFPVLGHLDGSEILTTFTDNAGTPIKQIAVFPGNTLTLTNVRTGAWITVGTGGSFQRRAARDGSQSIQVTGRGPFIPNPLTGEPGIWYLTGRARATFDADGDQTSARVAGTLVNLCNRLAS